jgi:hypothetical protein
MPQVGAKELCARFADDVDALRTQRPDLELVLLSDGAREMVDLLDNTFNPSTLKGYKPHRLVDFWHAVEKLGKAAAVVYGPEKSHAVLHRWKALLLNNTNARRRILLELYWSGCKEVRVGTERPVRAALTYLASQKTRMNFAAARASGLPIGSGNVEATCKSLVALRMKRPGVRWKTETGQHVLDLRAAGLSDRWSDAISLTFATLPPRVERAA